ncbi:MAG: hypothetical protein WCL00_14090 [Bacteroidota bacterium]
MNEFETWFFRAALFGALAVIWYFAKRVLNELKEMNTNIKCISDKGIVHDGKLELVENKVENHEKRINDHAGRIRVVERTQDSCKFCTE